MWVLSVSLAVIRKKYLLMSGFMSLRLSAVWGRMGYNTRLQHLVIHTSSSQFPRGLTGQLGSTNKMEFTILCTVLWMVTISYYMCEDLKCCFLFFILKLILVWAVTGWLQISDFRHQCTDFTTLSLVCKILYDNQLVPYCTKSSAIL